MAKLFLLVGIPGSGKSTYSKILKNRYNAEVVSSDIVRTNHPDWEEINIFPEVHRLCAEFLKSGSNVVYDATNYSKEVRKKAILAIKEYIDIFDVVVYYFPIDYKICEIRVAERNKNPHERFLPIEVIKKYFDMMEEPSLDEGFSEIIIIN